jgi:hypothetical protein
MPSFPQPLANLRMTACPESYGSRTCRNSWDQGRWELTMRCRGGGSSLHHSHIWSYYTLSWEACPVQPVAVVRRPAFFCHKGVGNRKKVAISGEIAGERRQPQARPRRGAQCQGEGECFNLLGQIPRSLLRLFQWCYCRCYERLST